MSKSFTSKRSFLKTSLLVVGSGAVVGALDAKGATVSAVPTQAFLNGKILTVDKDFRVVSAMAVAGNRILAVGTDAEILALCKDTTQRIDLNGKTVMPGIIDTHTHPVAAAMYEFDHAVPDMETMADVLSYFRERAKVVPTEEWIMLQQVFITRLREKRYPTRAELDSVAPNHAACMRTGPDVMLNSKALAKLGITRDSGEHPNSGHGRIERDDITGEPTGNLRNCTSIGAYLAPKTSATPEQQQDRVLQQLRAYLATGVTTVADRNTTDADISVYSALKTQGNLPCRVFMFHALDSKKETTEIEADIANISRSPLTKKNNELWLCGVKMFLDGGMLTGSARMREPWGKSEIYRITDEEYRGLLFVPQEKLVGFAKTAMRHGLQPSAHCVGDGALEALIEAYQIAVKAHKADATSTAAASVPNRPGICHGNFLYPEAITQIRELGAVIDMQPAWLYLDGSTLRDHFGYKRLRYFQPYKTLREQGVAAGGGSDHMLKIGEERSINRYSPFLGMWTMQTRQPRWTDTPIYPEESVSRQETIRFYTIDSAFVLRNETEQGSLEPGKLADFIILDRDILTCPVDELLKIKVLETWVDACKK